MLRKFIKLILLNKLRRNAVDVISIYDTFSNLMNITTGGNLLNFGYWDDDVNTPIEAQLKLTNIVGEFGRFINAKRILDLGSGYSIPAIKWLQDYPTTNIYCINLSYNQIKQGKNFPNQNQFSYLHNLSADSIMNLKTRLSHINSTSTFLAIQNNTMDRIVAFESAHHFRPFKDFITEARRILTPSGLLVIAIPILLKKSHNKLLPLWEVKELGILKITWASEHYELGQIKSIIQNNGFKVDEIALIGSNVYQPLANYYINNRNNLRKMILNHYPNYLEAIIHRSMSKMKTASEKGIIEYALFRSIKR